MQPLNEITVGSHLSELHLSEVLFYLPVSEHFSYPNTLWSVPDRIRDFSTYTNSSTRFAALFHVCLHVLADSVVVSVGQVVGEEEVVERMGTGGADELAQLNLSGHV